MKLLGNSLLLAFFVHAAYADTVVPCIKQENISICKDQIVSELKRTKYTQIGLATAGLALTGFGLYQLFKPEEFALHHPKDCEAVARLVDFAQRKMQDLPPVETVSTTPGFWHQVIDYTKFIFQSGLVMSVAGVISGVTHPFLTPIFKQLGRASDAFEGMIDKVAHETTLAWYVKSHTTLFDLLAALEKHAQGYADPVDASDFEYHKDSFIDSYNLLVSNIESVLGFIAYKTELLEKKSPTNASRAQHIAIRIQTKCDALTKHIEQAAEQSLWRESAQELKKEIINFKSLVQESFDSFALIEFCC
ncbi:MAG: hypothetical protein AB7R69_02525 [Candidatus Babeliales bacterium]